MLVNFLLELVYYMEYLSPANSNRACVPAILTIDRFTCRSLSPPPCFHKWFGCCQPPGSTPTFPQAAWHITALLPPLFSPTPLVTGLRPCIILQSYFLCLTDMGLSITCKCLMDLLD